MEQVPETIANPKLNAVLIAARDTLQHALERSKSLTVIAAPQDEIQENLERALRAVAAASSETRSTIHAKGYAANAVARLKTALKAVRELDRVDERIRLTGRATARAISLINSVTEPSPPSRDGAASSLVSRRRESVRSPRRGRSCPRFSVTIGEDATFFTGFFGDIASGGLFIATYDVYPVGTMLSVTAQLSRNRVIMGAAKVEWVRDHTPAALEISPGMGVVFQNLTKIAEREINEYLSENDSLFYEAV